jgi:hypothetical protein
LWHTRRGAHDRTVSQVREEVHQGQYSCPPLRLLRALKSGLKTHVTYCGRPAADRQDFPCRNKGCTSSFTTVSLLQACVAGCSRLSSEIQPAGPSRDVRPVASKAQAIAVSQVHLQSHKRAYCPAPLATFNSEQTSKLNRHLKTCKGKIILRPFKCPKCRKPFTAVRFRCDHPCC